MNLLPPPHLMIRVSGNAEPETYTRVGATAAERLMTAVNEWVARPVQDILDWGCGPGRVLSHIAASNPELNLYGCDIDAEAIAWCTEHLPGNFAVSPLYPPLSYEDSSFDAILAVSVMTHLPRRKQGQWLRDLFRILRPGGVFVASVHGQVAALSFGVTDLKNIQDHYLNIGLAGVAPDGYYRDVIQTETYTRMAWAHDFEIVAYEESALELHDVVVCRKPRDSS